MTTKHRIADKAWLFHGDCLKVLPTLPQVDFIFTDPPYGHNNNNNDDLIRRREHALKKQKTQDEEARPIMNDDFDQANQLFTASLPLWRKILTSGGYIACCCGGGGGHKGIQFVRWSSKIAKRFVWEQAIVYDKGPIGMGWRYRRSYEFVLIAHKKGKAKWCTDARDIENIIRPGDYGINKIIPSAKQHPTEKPWQLAAHFIQLHTKPGDIVLDPFMGSGSTGVAAVLTGRRFIGIELDEHWYGYAKQRIEQAVAYGRDTPPSTKKSRSTKEIIQDSIWTWDHKWSRDK